MKVGIISKEEHCKPHAKAIRAAGHEVKLLGGGPLVDVSPSIEVLVCRTASCAHSADATARAVKREGLIPVIFSDSVTGIMAKLNKLTGGKDVMKNDSAVNLFRAFIEGGGVAWATLPFEAPKAEPSPLNYALRGPEMAALARKSQSSCYKAIKALMGTGEFEVTIFERLSGGRKGDRRGQRLMQVPVLSKWQLVDSEIADVCKVGGFVAPAVRIPLGGSSVEVQQPIVGYHHAAHFIDDGWYVFSLPWCGDTRAPEKATALSGPVGKDEATEAILNLDQAIEAREEAKKGGVMYLVLRGLFTGKPETIRARFEAGADPVPHLWQPTLIEARDSSDAHFSDVKDKRRTPFRRLPDGTVTIGRSLYNRVHKRRLSVLAEERPDFFEWLPFDEYANSRGTHTGEDLTQRRSAPAPEPAPEPAPAPEPEPERDTIPSLLQQLLEAMREKDVKSLQHGPLEVTFRPVHLKAAGWQVRVCAGEGPSTTSLSEVTCDKCKETAMYQTAVYALAHFSA